MALIEKYILVADSRTVASGEEIIEGMLVKLDTTSGEIVVADGSTSEVCYGVAADTKSTSTSGLPTTNASGTAAYLAQANFVNRVSDSFDETRASGKITVYVGSGAIFLTNQFVASTGTPYAPGQPLYCSKTTDGYFTNATSDNDSDQIVGYVNAAPGDVDSGVPGLDVNGSMTLGDYLEVKMVYKLINQPV